MIYTQNVFISPSILMFKYPGISPALKYIVATVSRYHTFLPHSSSFVNRYAIYDVSSVHSAVPITVRATELIAPVPIFGSFMMFT